MCIFSSIKTTKFLDDGISKWMVIYCYLFFYLLILNFFERNGGKTEVLKWTTKIWEDRSDSKVDKLDTENSQWLIAFFFSWWFIRNSDELIIKRWTTELDWSIFTLYKFNSYRLLLQHSLFFWTSKNRYKWCA